jgi:carboxymethylenebutenolidase
MKRRILTLVLVAVTAAPAFTQEFALERIEASPRHHEWVVIPSGDRTVHGFVAFPERADDAPAVIVIHENRGLTDWVRSFADQMAAAGYLAIAPDLLSDFDAQHRRTGDFASSDAARDSLYRLDPDRITADLLAVQGYIAKVPSSSGTTAVVGFCWGGAQAFRFAGHAQDLAAAFVFYGSAPDEELIEGVSAPVYGFYAENDQRINAAIPATEVLMERHGKVYDYVIYDGGGHGFMRSGDDPAGSQENRDARDLAWTRLLQLLEMVE